MFILFVEFETRERKRFRFRLIMADKKDWKDIPEEKRGRVLVMYTGGTIGMKDFGKGEGFEPAPGFIHETLASLSMFHDHEFGTPTEESISDFTFVTPLLKAGKRAVYRVLEYVPILDSCNIGLKVFFFPKIFSDLYFFFSSMIFFFSSMIFFFLDIKNPSTHIT